MNTNFSQPVATLPHMIFVYAISPYNDWHAKAWATALVLIILILLLNILARLIVWWRSRAFGPSDDKEEYMSTQIGIVDTNGKASSSLSMQVLPPNKNETRMHWSR